MAAASSSAISLSSMMVITVIFFYTLINLALAVLSTIAWTKARSWVQSTECLLADMHCDFTRWGLYLFISIAAFVAFSSSAVMSCNTMSRSRNVIATPAYVFRCVAFTIALFTPLVVVGWSGLTMLKLALFDDESMGDFPLPGMNLSFSLGGLGGVFVIDSLNNSLPISRAALITIHINLEKGVWGDPGWDRCRFRRRHHPKARAWSSFAIIESMRFYVDVQF
ncbi:hypothetical protein HJFPF1_03614 [Paramyrothecium foliicola]|nr:hypothetical protein HJFPF1_03614 [Paramyrothecium foliicola]